jgi:hypothetical protein
VYKKDYETENRRPRPSKGCRATGKKEEKSV